MQALKRYIPNRIKQAAKILLNPRPNSPNDKYCPVCQTETSFRSFPYEPYFEKFYEHGFLYSPFLFETLNLKHYNCNNCGATDRERLMALYISKENSLFKNDKIKMLDFAPVKALSEFLKNLNTIIYRSADLYMQDVDDKVDITDMSIYKDESFDMLVFIQSSHHLPF